MKTSIECIYRRFGKDDLVSTLQFIGAVPVCWWFLANSGQNVGDNDSRGIEFGDKRLPACEPDSEWCPMRGTRQIEGVAGGEAVEVSDKEPGGVLGKDY